MSVDRKAQSQYLRTDLDIIRFQVLQNAQQEASKRSALLISDDTGEANTVLPIGLELIRRGWQVTAIVRGSALKIFSDRKEFNKDRAFNPESTFDEVKADVVISGVSKQTVMQATATDWGNRNGGLTVTVADYPGATVDGLSEGFKRNPNSVSKIVAVMDDRIKSVEEARLDKLQLPDSNRPLIIPTGQPNFDSLAGIHIANLGRDTREKHGVPQDANLFVWFGQKGFATLESLRVVIDSLRETNPDRWMLGVRFHPGDRENIDSGAYARSLSLISRQVINLMSNVEPDVINAIAVANTVLQERSTIALQASALDRFAGSIVIPSLLGYTEMSAGLYVPTNEDGTTPVAENRENVRELIINSTNQEFNARQARRREYYKQDGGAASRVADLIELRIAG